MRERLPDRRETETFTVTHRTHDGVEQTFIVSVGHYPDGRLGEIFIEVPYQQQRFVTALMAKDVATMLSIALQHGATVEELLAAHLDRHGARRAYREDGMNIYRHKKRGTLYQLIGYGKMQAENWRDHNRYSDGNGEFPDVDMDEVAIYQSLDAEGSLWVRPREEFEDGRFEVVRD